LKNAVNEGNKVLSFFYENKILYGGGSTFAARSAILKDMAIPDAVDMYIDEFLIIATLAMGDTYYFDRPYSVWRIHGKNYSDFADKNKVEEKHRRLLQSSLGVLAEIPALPLPGNVRDLYRLQHEVRRLHFLEIENKKSLASMGEFFVFLVKNKFMFKTLRKYAAFNRLIPTSVLRLLKSVQRGALV
ncbi:MAG TPA: hypothetical protein VKQ08_05625, partial [Cyclobacteriaceae bacterium]|nr:hypothetical protein [Cyclobacteriaceae bacterium]